MLGNRRFTAADLSSMVLRQLKEDAEKYLGEPVEEAVISVPAYFNDFQRNATKMAGELAGLTVERLVNEPSAAALAYRFGKTKEDQTFLVFDFGGGTLDISIVDAFDSVIEIVAVAGDNHLGGDDVNRAIAEKFLSVNRIDEGKITNEERASLIRESEKLKRTLTDATEGEMEVVIGGQIYQMKLDAKGLLEVSAKLLEGIGIPLKRAMNDSGYGWEDIDEIIMIGGSGKMKIVQNYLQFLSGKRPRCEIDPDVAVAVGAGMYAGIKERQQAVRDLHLEPRSFTEIPRDRRSCLRSLSEIRFFRSAGWSDTGRYISSRNTVISRFYRASTAMQTRIWSSDGSVCRCRWQEERIRGKRWMSDLPMTLTEFWKWM